MLALFLAAAIAWDAHLGDVRRQVVESQPFESAAITWIGDANVRIRTSADGVAWSDWTTPTRDEDIVERNATGITHFGAAKRFIEIDFDGPARRVTVTTFPPAPPGTSVAALPGAIRTRTEWGCPDGQASRGTPSYSKVTHAVVHHTAGSNNVQNWDAEVLSIWRFHTMTNGWDDIGYNFLIDPNGVIYEGRAGGDGVIGAHFSCANTNTVGIALLGTYTNVAPTAAALASLESLLAELMKRHGLYPWAMTVHARSELLMPTITSHRDGNPSTKTCTKTACPGDTLYALLPAIRSAVAAQTPAPPRRRAGGR